jgi:hypothetical protein
MAPNIPEALLFHIDRYMVTGIRRSCLSLIARAFPDGRQPYVMHG